MKRQEPQFGDCYELKISEGNYVYFQYIAKDYYQLDSECVRFFKLIRSKPFSPEESFEEILVSGSWFYSHTYIKEMLRDFYKKVSHEPLPENELTDLTFHYIIDDLKDGEFVPKYIVRKLGADVEDSVVDHKTYSEMKKKSWMDGVSGPHVYIQRIPMKLKDPNYEHLY